MQFQSARAVLPVLALAFLSAACGDADQQAAPEGDVAAQAGVQSLSAEMLKQLALSPPGHGPAAGAEAVVRRLAG